jgi:methyl-accepting chemotaxis protein
VLINFLLCSNHRLEMSTVPGAVQPTFTPICEIRGDSDHQAREGDKVVGEAVAQIERLAIEVGNSTAAMGNLREESNKIGGVLDVIKSVAWLG